MTRVGDKYSKFFCTPRFSWQSCRIAPTDSSLVMIIAVMIGSSIFSMSPGFGNFAVHARDAVSHARRRRDKVEAELAFQALLHDFHVQQAEKAATKTEAERHGVFGLIEKGRVVEL